MCIRDRVHVAVDAFDIRHVLTLHPTLPLSELGDRVADKVEVPLAQLRLQGRDRSRGLKGDYELDDWDAMPELRKVAGPVVAASAVALLAAGVPSRLVECAIKVVRDRACGAAPVTVLPENRGSENLVASYNTPDGLPLGPRVRLSVSYSGESGSQQIDVSLPACIRMSHLVKHIRERINPDLRISSPFGAHFILQHKDGRLPIDATRLEQMPAIAEDLERSEVLELELREFEIRVMRGRPLSLIHI
eukprot:TRINITY_DN3650_c0_g1_i1.p1 TRINITY_DN3650_c0_g1~~TRINITY_DN3650_c0_g1_i1.p1  ORF type:complete len:247 (-),score=39.46 TRINITY_DN3650_c0_g1_i1:155-895(-)